MPSLEKRIRDIYAQAEKELTEKVDSFFANFEKKDVEMRKKMEAGKISEAQYTTWRRNKMLSGKDYQDLRDNVADMMLDANRIAASYINGEMIPEYTKGYNQIGRDGEKHIPGYSFTMIDENAVKRLTTDDTTLLPYKTVDGRKDVRWNTKKVNSSILQSIIQGESLPNAAKRLMKICGMNKESAIRNARTAMTSAHNSGRLDAMKKLQDDGAIMKKVWLAARDSHTRDAHAELDGQMQDIDKPFKNSIGEIMAPGDINADPANVYNCRCDIGSEIIGFRGKDGKIVYVDGHQDVQYEFGNLPQASADSYRTQLERLMAEYPMLNEGRNIAWVGDFRIPHGIDINEDYIDIIDRDTSLNGIAAEFMPKSRFSERPYIMIYDPEIPVENMDDWLDALVNIREKYGWHSKKDSFWNMAAGTESTITHEYGHALAYDCGMYWGGKNFDKLNAIFKSHSSEEIGRELSLYAATSPQEMFAEAFVASHNERLRTGLVNEIMDLFKEVRGK